jgi:type I restriction enzyme M protein
MAVWSTVHATSVQNNFGRFDAEFYRPENLDAFRKITGRKNDLLGALSIDGYRVVYQNTRILPTERVTAQSAKFLQANNITANGLSIDYDKIGYVTESDWLRYPKGRILRGELLIEVKGQAEKVTIVPEDFPRRTLASGSLFKLTINDLKINPWYVFVYFSTKHGRLLRDRLKTNTLIGFVSKPQLYSIPIFIPELDEDQANIAQIAKDAFRSISESERLYTQAQRLLEAELGLDKLHFDKPVYYTAQFSNLELSRRLDSEHFYPQFDHLKAKSQKKIEFVPLSSVLNFCQRGKQPIYTKDGLPVLNSKHILENKITLEGNRKAKRSMIESLQIQYGDVLINGTGRGTIGRTAPYLISDHQSIPDNHVTILRSPSLDPAYLSFYLNSLAGKLQVEKHQRGSSGQLELYPFDIRKFWVWVAPQSIQQEIRRLYDKATENAIQAKQLLEQAKSRVEQLIEEAVQT